MGSDCDHKLQRSDRYDAMYCALCDEWRESKCCSELCFYCKKRPARPSIERQGKE